MRKIEATARYVTKGRVADAARRLNQSDWSVLEFLRVAGYATTRQVERFCFTEGTALARARASRRSLERLVRLNAAYRLERRIGGLAAGSDQGIYTLDRAGWRLLEARGHLPPVRVRRPDERGLAFLSHSLLLTESLVMLAERERQEPEFELVTWLGHPHCRRLFTYRGKVERLSPDAFVEVRREGEVISSFLEIDRGTESLPTLLRRLGGYLRYARLYGSETPQVVVALHHPARVDRLAEELPTLSRREGLRPSVGTSLFRLGELDAAISALAGGDDLT